MPKVYNAIERVGTLRFRQADVIVFSSRRAAWLGKEPSSTFPLIQQGSLTQAVGQQDGGFVRSFGGLEVVIDGNISTEFAASTDEDEIYVVDTPDLALLEGPLRVRVFNDVLSGTLQVRLQVVAYSAFVSARQPKAIAKIAGTALKGATF